MPRNRPDSSSTHSKGRVSQTAPDAKSLSTAVWGYLESIPGFNDDLRAAEAELEAGRGVRYEVRGGALRRVQPKS